MEKEYLKILRDISNSKGDGVITPESEEQYQIAKYLWDNELFRAEHHTDSLGASSVISFKKAELTHKGRMYLVDLDKRYPSRWIIVLKWMYILVTASASLVVALVGFLADWSTILG